MNMVTTLGKLTLLMKFTPITWDKKQTLAIGLADKGIHEIYSFTQILQALVVDKTLDSAIPDKSLSTGKVFGKTIALSTGYMYIFIRWIALSNVWATRTRTVAWSNFYFMQMRSFMTWSQLMYTLLLWVLQLSNGRHLSNNNKNSNHYHHHQHHQEKCYFLCWSL